ncbi:MAG TPA: hypothetical protein EYP34_01605 [Chromatiaceae bacterium]|nr:hypothetical protein [Chromatiaceae bacterium]
MNIEAVLLWIRGPGLGLALGIFLFGMAIKLLEIFLLGRKKNLAAVRSSGVAAGFRTILSRSLPPDGNILRRPRFTFIFGYAFHIGLFVVMFFLAPHIEVSHALLGLSWPALPTPVVDVFTIISIIAMMALLWHRLTSPLLKYLTTPQDYLVWALTFAPLLSGYMAYHHLLLPYTWLLSIHIGSVELLLILFPFTKLTHAFTLFIARWYTGMMAGQKGVQS